MNPLLACVALGLGLSLSPSTAKFEWQPSYVGALEKAASEKRVVFAALDFAEEGRCEFFLNKLTKDKLIVAASERTLNVVGASELHKKSGSCPRFKGLECEEHRVIEGTLLEEVLLPNDNDVVAVPQYLWLDGEGNVLLSVPYEIDRDGLLWCFETAQRLVNPEGAAPLSEESRPPRRLLMGRAFQTTAEDAQGRGMTPSELEKALDESKQSFMGMTDAGLILRLMFTAEPDAVKYVQVQVSFTIETFARRRLAETIHSMGRLSPDIFWEAIAEFKDTKDLRARHEIPVAFEQLGAPDALKFVKSQLKAEKDPVFKRAWVRALGACGATDKGVRKSLIKLTSEKEDQAMRASAAVAMGYLQRDGDVRAAWRRLLEGDSGELRVAAACGAALARDRELLPAVEKAAAEAKGENKASLERVLAVLKDGDLHPIEGDVARVTGDELPRERIFFSGQGSLPGTGDADE